MLWQSTPRFSEFPDLGWFILWPLPKTSCPALFWPQRWYLSLLVKCLASKFSGVNFVDKYHLCFGFSSFGFTMTCGVAITISVTRIFIIVKVKAFLSDLSPIIVYPCCTETNLDQISSSESRPSTNFKISTKHKWLDQTSAAKYWPNSS